jgi:hypothetical protein
MRVLWIAAVLTALTGPALAQFAPTIPLNGGSNMTPEQKARLEANERAARAASASVPTPKASDDPWANARSTPEPAKPAGKHRAGR